MNRAWWLDILYITVVIGLAITAPALFISWLFSWGKWSFIAIFLAAHPVLVALWLVGLGLWPRGERSSRPD